MVAQIYTLVSPTIPALPCPPWCADPHTAGDPGLHKSVKFSLGQIGDKPVTAQRVRLDPEPGCPDETHELWLTIDGLLIEMPIADATVLPQQMRTIAASLELILGGAR